MPAWMRDKNGNPLKRDPFTTQPDKATAPTKPQPPTKPTKPSEKATDPWMYGTDGKPLKYNPYTTMPDRATVPSVTKGGSSGSKGGYKNPSDTIRQAAGQTGLAPIVVAQGVAAAQEYIRSVCDPAASRLSAQRGWNPRDTVMLAVGSSALSPDALAAFWEWIAAVLAERGLSWAGIGALGTIDGPLPFADAVVLTLLLYDILADKVTLDKKSDTDNESSSAKFREFLGEQSTPANPPPDDDDWDDEEDSHDKHANKKPIKGKSFRGGGENQRDKWYGITDRKFKKWWEQIGKGEWGGSDILDPKMAREIYEAWVQSGRPTVK